MPPWFSRPRMTPFLPAYSAPRLSTSITQPAACSSVAPCGTLPPKTRMWPGAQFLRHVHPLPEPGEFLLLQFGRGLGHLGADGDAVDLHRVPVGQALERQQELVGGVGEPVDGHIERVDVLFDGDAHDVVVRHGLLGQFRPVGIAADGGAQAGFARRGGAGGRATTARRRPAPASFLRNHGDSCFGLLEPPIIRVSRVTFIAAAGIIRTELREFWYPRL